MKIFKSNFKEFLFVGAFALILGCLILLQMSMAAKGLGYGILITQLIIYSSTPIVYENVYYRYTDKNSTYLKTLIQFSIIFLVDSAFFKLAVSMDNGTFEWQAIPIRAIGLTAIAYLIWIVYVKIKKAK